MATRPTRFNPSDSVSGFAKLRKNSSATEETGSSHSPASSGRSGGNSPDKKSAADHENNYFNKTESRLKCVQTPPPIKEEALEDGEKQKEEATDPTNQTQLDKVQTRPLPEVPK